MHAPPIPVDRMSSRLFALLALVFALVAAPAAAQPAPRIGVATMAPGTIFFERFGHNAIVVADPSTGEATSYNFGYFDPTEPDFVMRFVRGEMRYRLEALPLERDLAYYRETGRGVTLQWLRLTPVQAAALSAALAENAKPENAVYAYQYFDDNCATRVRDAIDRALEGRLRPQLQGRSHGNTHRSEALRLSRPAPWMWLGFDLGLSQPADLPRSVWDESYVPMRLAQALRESRASDGGPLVLAEETLLPHRTAPEPGEVPIDWRWWAVAGAAIAIALLWLRRRAPRLVGGIALGWWALCAVLGAVMLFLWWGTAHRYGWANRNLLLFAPLWIVLLPAAWRMLRGRAVRAWASTAAWGLVLLAAMALFAFWLPLVPQQNLHWIVAVLPVHAALAWAVSRAVDRRA